MKKLRLKDFDYSTPGYYFITICVKNKENIFGIIENETLLLNEFGKIAHNVWQNMPKHYNEVEIDEFIVMPNHLHGIIILNNEDFINSNVVVGQFIAGVGQSMVGVGQCPTPTYGKISKIINSYKNIVTKTIRKIDQNINFQWQRSFYDNIIRDEESLDNIRNYIKYNYLKWNDDKYYNY